nr:metallopeptidase family protein [Chloroflexota bacterium]
MVELTASQFAALVEEALADLPEDIQQHMDNVVITISDWPSPGELKRAGVNHPSQLFGLYEGIPLPHRGRHYNLVTPDRIVIYRGPLLHACPTVVALREQVRRTVVHEIAHHFGISEARLRELGY